MVKQVKSGKSACHHTVGSQPASGEPEQFFTSLISPAPYKNAAGAIRKLCTNIHIICAAYHRVSFPLRHSPSRKDENTVLDKVPHILKAMLVFAPEEKNSLYTAKNNPPISAARISARYPVFL